MSSGLAAPGQDPAGTPTQAGTFTFPVKVAASSGKSATQQFSLTIKDQGGHGGGQQ